jgi:hypothetical protein
MGSFSIWHWLVVLVVLLLPVIIGIAVIGLQKKILLSHMESGLTKNGYVGFCWTYLIFGWIVPVVRGEIWIGVLHMILTAISLGLFQIIMPFLYNKQYTSRLLTSGWVLADIQEKNELARRKLGITRGFRS